MKNDEFAFFNQQLAAMLRDGIPLESALKRLCAEMQNGNLRGEFEQLGADLAKGISLSEAIRTRKLPELYRQMMEVGARSNDLPGILTMLADYYQRRHVVAARLKGLMVYPAIVLVATFLLSVFLGVLVNFLVKEVSVSLWVGTPLIAWVLIWAAPAILGIAVIVAFAVLATRGVRQSLRWKAPAFRETSLAQFADAMAMMLKSGVPFDAALGLMEHLERGTPAQRELSRWRQRLAAGQGKFAEMTADSKVFPPLFIWTVTQSHEDLAGGFQRAAEMYRSRADYRTESLLYSALPCSILALGLLILTQLQPTFVIFKSMMDSMDVSLGK